MLKSVSSSPPGLAEWGQVCPPNHHRRTAPMHANLASFLDGISTFVHQVLARDLPELLSLSAGALKKAPIPSSGTVSPSLSLLILSRPPSIHLQLTIPSPADGWRHLTTSDWLALAPFLGCVLLALSLPMATMLYHQLDWAFPLPPAASSDKAALTEHAVTVEQYRRKEGVHRRKNSFWLARLVLLRGMGLIYLTAFATSAFQSRALFGTMGLSPALGDKGKLGGDARPTLAFDHAAGMIRSLSSIGSSNTYLANGRDGRDGGKGEGL